MSSSGVHVGAFQELKIGHLKDMPNGCKSVLVYADTIHEYYTFIHKEAVESLNEYFDTRRKKGEIITDNSWVFCSPRDSSIASKQHAISSGISRYVEKTLGRTKVKEDRFEIMSCHGMRKRFATILKSNGTVNNNLAEKFMGHSEDPERISTVSHSCKRLIKSVADDLFSSQKMKHKMKGGEMIEIGEDKYFNRLIAFIDKIDSKNRKGLLEKIHLLKNLYGEIPESMNKGTHKNISNQSAEMLVIYCYLILGEIILEEELNPE